MVPPRPGGSSRAAKTARDLTVAISATQATNGDRSAGGAANFRESGEALARSLGVLRQPRDDTRLRYAVSSLNAATNRSICGLVPIVTRMKFGSGGKSRPTWTFRSLNAAISGFTSRRMSIIMKFACEGM
ncbi:MAG: hypothetical protein QOD80_1325 [Verrucomicrobiota bacterium]